jgi:membrane protein DedA with SNARE-associated domain
MSADTFVTIWVVVGVIIVLVGMTLAGLGKIEPEDTLLAVILAVTLPAFVALSWPYWLAKCAKWNRERLIESRRQRAAQIERDYQEIQRLIV